MVTMTGKGGFDGTLTLNVWNTVLIAPMVTMTGNWSKYLLVFGQKLKTRRYSDQLPVIATIGAIRTVSFTFVILLP